MLFDAITDILINSISVKLQTQFVVIINFQINFGFANNFIL